MYTIPIINLYITAKFVPMLKSFLFVHIYRQYRYFYGKKEGSGKENGRKTNRWLLNY